MKIPHAEKFIKEWNINGVKWTVKKVKRFPPGASESDGFCCHDTKIIYLKHNLKSLDLFSTFLHEYFHALEHKDTYNLFRLKGTHKKIYALESAILELFINL